MKICWITCFPIVSESGDSYSNHAAVRMRTIAPIRVLRSGGHTIDLVSIAATDGERPIDAGRGYDAAVFDQLYPRPNQSFAQAAQVRLTHVALFRRAGVMTVADVHDDHFALPGRVEYYRQTFELIDRVVVNSPYMQTVVAGHCGRPIKVIGDPFEGPHGAPAFAPSATVASGLRGLRRLWPWSDPPALRLTWFGHPSNFRALLELMPRLSAEAQNFPIHVTVVSAGDSEIAAECAVFNHYHGRSCRMIFVPWSQQATWSALQGCDICVLPVSMESRTKLAKSANRLIEVLRAGRFAVASPLAAYARYAPYACVGEDLLAGIRWALAHPAQVLERIRAGQDLVERTCCAEVIAGEWESALRDRTETPGDRI